MESECGVPGDVVGPGSQRLIGWVAATQHGDGCAVKYRQAISQARATSRMSVLVPPAIFEKEVAVLDLPMIADLFQQLCGRDPPRVEAGNKIATVVRDGLAVGSQYIAIDAQSDPAARKVQFVANVIRVGQGEPQPAAICQGPLFSIVSAAGGRCWAWPKQACKASCTSGWLALTWNR